MTENIRRVRVTPSTFSISEYVDQLNAGTIVINREYQRSDKVWPISAKSYLIDTVLHGYPMPKLSLYQRTDLKSRKTIKEVVDGQQRSQAIRDFYEGKFKIVGSSDFSGKRFDDLEEDQKIGFLSYVLSVDLFLLATPAEIREMFRRINSYTVPLNPQEKRHAINQGEFKFFMVGLSDKYSESLKQMGVLTEKQLSRMADTELLSDIIMSWIGGIDTIRGPRLDKFYSENDKNFPQGAEIDRLFSDTMSILFQMREIHNTNLMKPYNFHSLFLAIAHTLHASPALQDLRRSDKRHININNAVYSLSQLSDAIENRDTVRYPELIRANSSSTNLKINRQTRFKYYFDAVYETN